MPSWTILLDAARPARYNLAKLKEEARAALAGFGVTNAMIDLNEVEPNLLRAYVHSVGMQPPGMQIVYNDTVAAHNPDALTPEQQADRRQGQARAALDAQDFAQVRDALQAAATLAALRPILLAMLRLIHRLAAAQALTRQDEP